MYTHTHTLFKGNMAFCIQVSNWERKARKGISSQQTVAARQVTSLLASPVFQGGMCHPSTVFLCTQHLKKARLPQKLHFLFRLRPSAKKHTLWCAERAHDAKGRRPSPWCWLCRRTAGTAFVLAAPAGCVFFGSRLFFGGEARHVAGQVVARSGSGRGRQPYPAGSGTRSSPA